MTNMLALKPSRKKPKTGDFFAAQPAEDMFVFGRVVSTEARWSLADDAAPANLIYIYQVTSGEKVLPDRSLLRPENLLISPVMTNSLPWSRGYFETLANTPLAADDVLSKHCFVSAWRGKYFDEHGAEMSGPIEPVGDFGLHSYRTIDDELSDALGIPRVPEDQ